MYFKLCPIGGAIVHLSADIVTDKADILLLAAPSSSFPRKFSSCGLCCRLETYYTSFHPPLEPGQAVHSGDLKRSTEAK